MSVTTKTGDKGQTRLFTGQSIAKDDLRVETYGTIDQLTATIGMARAFAQNGAREGAALSAAEAARHTHGGLREPRARNR